MLEVWEKALAWDLSVPPKKDELLPPCLCEVELKLRNQQQRTRTLLVSSGA